VKYLSAAFGALVVALSLAACGGGGGGGGGSSGGGGGGMPPTPTPTPPVGDQFTYAGSLQQSDTFTYPSPSPFPNTTASASVTVNVAVTLTPAPFVTPAGGAYDIHDSESDAFSNVTNVSTTDTWAATTSTATQEYGSVVTTGSGSSAAKVTRTYTAPYVLDELPETNGANWSNSPAGTSYETDPDGETISRTIAGNGTYSETQNLVNGQYTLTIAENADGSGTYSGTLLSWPIEYSAPQGGTITIEVVPTASPTPSPGTTANPSPIPTPFALGTPPAWYGSTAPSLYTENDSVATGVSFPASCNVPAQYGTTGNAVTRAITSWDTILGYKETQTYVDYDTQSAGIVCIAMNDKQVYYYDYLDDTSGSYDNFADFAGTPQQTVTISETVGLQTETLAASAHRSAQSLTGHTLSSQQIAAAIARFQVRALQARRTREKAIERSLRAIEQRMSRGGQL
jgi:hypothetical protein